MTPPAAPFLTAADLCSDCKVKPVTLDRGAMRVCPNCFALLWHANSGTEESRRATARKLLVDRAEAAMPRAYPPGRAARRHAPWPRDQQGQAMTPTEQQILALLEQKPALTQFTPTYRWLIEAVELLLRHQSNCARSCATTEILR